MFKLILLQCSKVVLKFWELETGLAGLDLQRLSIGDREWNSKFKNLNYYALSAFASLGEILLCFSTDRGWALFGHKNF
jgi:hypothetical protein